MTTLNDFTTCPKGKGGGNLNEPIFNSSNTRGVAPAGMLKF